MVELKKRLHDAQNGLDYALVGDYYLPDRVFDESADPIGRWSRMHGRYLKENHPVRYNAMLLSGKLNSYLAQIDEQAQKQLDLIIRQMQQTEDITEELKAANQMEWVRRMNSIQERAEEIVRSDFIYLNSRLPIANGYLKFVCSGILCEAVSVALFGVFHFGDPEVRKMLKYLVNHIGKR